MRKLRCRRDPMTRELVQSHQDEDQQEERRQESERTPTIERQEIDPPGIPAFLQEKRCDQKAAQHKEQSYSSCCSASRELEGNRMRNQDKKDRNSTDAIESRA